MVKNIFIKITGEIVMQKLFRLKGVIIFFSFFVLLSGVLLSNILPSGGRDGSYWRPGSSQHISWDALFLDTTKLLNIYLWNGDSSTLTLIGSNIIPTNEYYIWDIPSYQELGDHFKIKITYTDTLSDFYLISRDFFPISTDELVLSSAVFSSSAIDSIMVVVTPNPTPLGSMLTVLSDNKFFHIDIYDLSGSLIVSYNFDYTDNYVVDISGLSSGAYIVQIKFLGCVVARQFILE